ncbi:MOSC domain-containing protein [Candidatus Poribacteria bacterium]|nr:MOSC domain-containing protein [Candidatus Poribacteria bacterium]
MSKHPNIHSIFIGQPKTIADERGTWTSSIYRDSVDGPVQLQKGGLAGDKVAQPYHGGPDAAVCVHLLNHYRFWNEHYGMNLKPGHVGENFTLDNLTEDQVCAGDIVRVGTALLQVSGPRVPCANLARCIGRSDWVKLTITENRTGFYMRVLEPGTVQRGDAWLLQERLNPDGSIPAINRCVYLCFDPSYAIRMTQMHGLGDWWKEIIIEKREKHGEHWTVTMKE